MYTPLVEVCAQIQEESKTLKMSHFSGRRDLLMLLASLQGRESPFVPNALAN